MENNGLPDGFGIDVVLTIFIMNQYSNVEYNNKHHNLLRNGKI